MTPLDAARPPQVVVLAGGLGTRMGALSARTPKVLLPVGGRPFLARLLDHHARQGVRELHLCLGHLADQVLRFLDVHGTAGMHVTSTVETEPLGTAGSLRLALPHLADEFALVMGDSHTPAPLAELAHRWHGSGLDAAMAVLRNHDWLVPGNVAVQDGRVTTYDKGRPPGTYAFVDYGITLLRRSTVEHLPGSGNADLAALYAPLVATGRLAALEVTERFWEIGSPAGYAEYDAHVAALEAGSDRVHA
ncbi:NTP transferase domain-containing protein [Streptomyces sp. NPDC059445]|uniref:NTP transferase domain-containing protein n=1 Tax=Streptomyces sp. NPDC059445 TaxID=3346832 RepID=UPI0036CFF8F4